MWNAYIRVDDVEALYAEAQERGATIDYRSMTLRMGFGSSEFRTRTATT
jgi:hypothetical protein